MRRGGRRCQGLYQFLVVGGELVCALLVGQVEVAEDPVGDPDRYAEERAHRRVMVGEADRGDVLGDVAQPQRLGVVHQQPQQSLAFRQVPDPGHHFGVHAGMHKAHQPAAADHAECGVAGVDQFPGGLHDVAQHRVEVIGVGHRQVGAQQATQPALGVLHVAGPRHQLLEQLVQLQPGHLRERHSRRGITGRGGGAGVGLAPADVLTHVDHRPATRRSRPGAEHAHTFVTALRDRVAGWCPRPARKV